MLTRPVKGFLLSLLTATVVVAPLAVTVPAHANGCLLPGAGTEADPWLVDSQADFQKVGQTPCSLAGHYLQTADLTGVERLDEPNDDWVGLLFTGTYDGDHYEIELGTEEVPWTLSGPPGATALFGELGDGGELRKIRLSGHLTTGINSTAGSLVGRVHSGGVVSEVYSSVNIESTTNSVTLGGLSYQVDQGGRIQYSVFAGTITWNPTSPQTSMLGGLAGQTNQGSGTRPPEFRDSYSVGEINFPASASASARAGGIVGLTFQTGVTRIIRSYSATTISPGTNNGGLVGWIGGTGVNVPEVVSSFWLVSDSTPAESVGFGDEFDDFDSAGLPVAPGLDSTELGTLTSFTSKESAPGSGNPGGAEIAVEASGKGATPTAPDYRWAIEAGDVSVFIPSFYDGGDDATNRALFSDTSVARTYQTRGSNLEGTATGYPSLGRVWELCPDQNSGFPVLVWEERGCSSPISSSAGNQSSSAGNQSSSGRHDRDEEVAVVAEVPTLAATGTSSALGPVGLATLLLSLGLGAILVASRKKANTEA